MGAKENLELIEELQRALRDLDLERYGQLLADDATLRTAGVPRVGWGTHRPPGDRGPVLSDGERGQRQIKQIFGDDKQVYVVGKVTAERFVGRGPMTTIARSDVARAHVAAALVCGADLRSHRLPTSLIRATSVGNAVGFRGFVRCAVTVR